VRAGARVRRRHTPPRPPPPRGDGQAPRGS
jgi:hypothetical protein